MINRLSFGNGVEQYTWDSFEIKKDYLHTWGKHKIEYNSMVSAYYDLFTPSKYTIPANTTSAVSLYTKYRYVEPEDETKRYYNSFNTTGSMKVNYLIGQLSVDDTFTYPKTTTTNINKLKVYVGETPSTCNNLVMGIQDQVGIRWFQNNGGGCYYYDRGYPYVKIIFPGTDGKTYEKCYLMLNTDSQIMFHQFELSETEYQLQLLVGQVARLNGMSGGLEYLGVQPYGIGDQQFGLFASDYWKYYDEVEWVEDYTSLKSASSSRRDNDKIIKYGEVNNTTDKDKTILIFRDVQDKFCIKTTYKINWETNSWNTHQHDITFDESNNCYISKALPIVSESHLIEAISNGGMGNPILITDNKITVYNYINDTLMAPFETDYYYCQNTKNDTATIGQEFYKIYIHDVQGDFGAGELIETLQSWDATAYPHDGIRDNYYYKYIGFDTSAKVPVPGAFKEQVKSLDRNTYPDDGAQGNAYYVYSGSDFLDTSMIGNSNLVGGITYNMSINPDNDFYYGCVASAELKFSLRFDGTDNEFYRLLEETGHPQLEHIFKFGSDDYHRTGLFNRYSIVRHKNTLDLVYYDNVLKLDKNVDDWIDGLTFPIKITDFTKSLADYCGVNIIFAETGLVNLDMMLQDNFTSTNMTGRQILQYVCQVVGAFAMANHIGDIEVKPYVKKDINLTNSQYKKFEYNYSVIPNITQLKVAMTQDDTGVKSGASDYNVYLIENNPLFYANSVEEIQPYVDNLFDDIKTINYVPATVEIIGDYGIECGDIITVDNKTFYVMEKTIEASGITLKCIGQEKRDETSTELNSQLNALRGKSNELLRTIEETKSTLTDTEKSLRSEIKQTADSITSSVEDQINETKSEFKQTTDSISMEVQEQGKVVAQLTLDVDGIYAKGYVTFTDLAGEGTTTINGANITTGTISADRINMTGAISWGDLSSSCQDTIASYAGADAELPSYIHNTYISSTEIRSPTIYGAKIYAGTSAEGYVKLSSTGMNFYSDSGGSVCGIGYYPGNYNLPYIILGSGVDSVGTDRGMIKKYTNGIWIGDSDNMTSNSPGGTGIFINFNSGTIQKYNNGSVSTL